MLLRINEPKILDIGCGPGEQTMELAKISKGKIIGIDIHQLYLDELEKKIKENNLTNQVNTINM